MPMLWTLYVAFWRQISGHGLMALTAGKVKRYAEWNVLRRSSQRAQRSRDAS